MNNNESSYMTIREAVIFTGKSERTLYRYIKQGKLNCLTVPVSAGQMPDSNRQSVRVKKDELARVFNITTGTMPDSNQHMPDTMSVSAGQLLDDACQVPDSVRHVSGTYQQGLLTKDDITEILKDNLKDVVTTSKLQDFFETKQTQLIKPLEEHALVKYGAISKENEFLKQRLETVLHENELLREQVKALPAPADIELKENTILLLQKENAENMALLQKEKEELLSRGEQNIKELESKLKREKEETETRLLREKEEALKKAEEETRKQKEELESRLKSEEEEKVRAKAEAEEALKQLKELPAPAESIQQILLDNATNLTKLTKEKESFQSVLKEHESTIKEKEKALKEIEELRKQELEGLKKQAEEREAKLKAEAEEREKQIAEAWKKELELARKPWWKWW